ncbi:winged helix-turn-helix domain-containing protein [Halalkalibacterium halodurans]|nr:winged helix-turn-helix domain-containing protein [Halalkalibacterium halodurans]MDY7220884.1 winged helix-turn-helix domain-containing protein [Halalkalibacterium halodurans]MDY7240123.1 winged helix-turn-helix domain-containing protein [Halalkalibacterium halodurans]MED4082560.1 winged helix-turn-helix domain-containing protein [Halalkalibacterium halodurans]MED4085805.1 winged helix-turn-helix domain-containing protein [Halalkalibacterium halodurans]MED4105671.1 winged helix-turn-helix d
MMQHTNLSLVASLVSDDSRGAMMTVLLDGRFHTATELALAANITPQTASFHLTKMVEAHLVAVEKQGRHRYYGIVDSDVANVLESLLAIAPPKEIHSFNQATEDHALRFARTCYDHLAGHVGVQLMESLLQNQFIFETENGFSITDKGERFFSDFQVNLEELRKKRRSFSHKCLDWSERRPHLAGALGHALLERFYQLHWIERLPRSRALTITPLGKTGFRETFSMDVLAEKNKN